MPPEGDGHAAAQALEGEERQQGGGAGKGRRCEERVWAAGSGDPQQPLVDIKGQEADGLLGRGVDDGDRVAAVQAAPPGPAYHLSEDYAIIT